MPAIAIGASAVLFPHSAEPKSLLFIVVETLFVRYSALFAMDSWFKLRQAERSLSPGCPVATVLSCRAKAAVWLLDWNVVARGLTIGRWVALQDTRARGLFGRGRHQYVSRSAVAGETRQFCNEVFAPLFAATSRHARWLA